MPLFLCQKLAYIGFFCLFCSKIVNGNNMKGIKFVLIAMVTAVLVSCGTTNTVPITGRKQNLMVTDGEVLSLSTQQYQEFMKSAKLSTNQTNTAMVKRVGQNLATAVNSYLSQNGLSSDLQYYNWTFNLVQDKQVNAWCMPGGLICVYEGLLPVTQNEASLGIQIGSMVAGALGMGTNTQSIVQAIVAQGFNFKNLKYSRDHENEADHMGLIFAAMAGYDPKVATDFWKRMAAQSNNQTAEFLSDHPSDATRIQNIQGWMPEALKYYKPKTTTVTRSAATTKKTTAKKTTTKKKK